MKVYKRKFNETTVDYKVKGLLDEFFISRKLKKSDIIPVMNYKKGVIDEYIVLEINNNFNRDDWEFNTSIQQKNIIYTVIIKKLKNARAIYELPVLKDGNISKGLTQITYNSYETKDDKFMKKFYKEELTSKERKELEKELEDLELQIKKSPFPDPRDMSRQRELLSLLMTDGESTDVKFKQKGGLRKSKRVSSFNRGRT